MGRKISLIARLLLAAAGIAYIAYSVQWSDELDAAGEVVAPGIGTMLRGANWGLLALGELSVVLVMPLQALRWLLLMRVRGLEVTFGRALRLTLVGMFFNFCMPGTTGGDVVKGYYAARRSDRRADAVMSVIFDRITGLVGLVVLSGVAGVFMLDNALVQRVTLVVWAMAVLLVIGAALYFSQRVRRTLRLGRLVNRLPGKRIIRAVDAAALAYGKHRLAVGIAIAISAVTHLLLALGTATAGYAMGIEVALGVLLVVIPLIALAGAVPLTFQGLGIMEGIGMALLLPTGLATQNQIIAMLLFARLYQVVIGLIGATLLLGGDIHLHDASETAEAANSKDELVNSKNEIRMTNQIPNSNG